MRALALPIPPWPTARRGCTVRPTSGASGTDAGGADSPEQTAREAQLARRAAQGDGAAFAILYDRYEQRIFTFCQRLTGSADDAADATQEAFVSMLERLPSLADRDLNFGAYLFTTARHSAYRVMEKRRKAEPTDVLPERGASGGGFGAGMDPDQGHPEEHPERTALVEGQQEQVRAAHARLPERQHEVLVLRELEKMSYDEIAEIMDMNRNSVAQLISRARIKLRDKGKHDDAGAAIPVVATTSTGAKTTTAPTSTHPTTVAELPARHPGTHRVRMHTDTPTQHKPKRTPKRTPKTGSSTPDPTPAPTPTPTPDNPPSTATHNDPPPQSVAPRSDPTPPTTTAVADPTPPTTSTTTTRTAPANPNCPPATVRPPNC